jgi:hypothetical protein
MFTFSAAEAAVIQTTYEDLDEMLAATKLRQLFPSISDNAWQNFGGVASASPPAGPSQHRHATGDGDQRA